MQEVVDDVKLVLTKISQYQMSVGVCVCVSHSFLRSHKFYIVIDDTPYLLYKSNREIVHHTKDPNHSSAILFDFMVFAKQW